MTLTMKDALRKADGTEGKAPEAGAELAPVLSWEDMLARFKTYRGEARDSDTGLGGVMDREEEDPPVKKSLTARFRGAP